MKWPESPKLVQVWPVLGSPCHWTKDTGSEYPHAGTLGTLMESKQPQARSPQAQVPVLCRLDNSLPFLGLIVPICK